MGILDAVTPPAPQNRVVREYRVIDASADAIFEYLADPRNHAAMDGSGMILGEVQGPSRLALDDVFTVAMEQIAMKYRSINHVVVFEEGQHIAWETYGERDGKRVIGGQVWGFLLKDADRGTLVQHYYDWGVAKFALSLWVGGYPSRARKAMRESLDLLPSLV